jgi:hypothetical protein
MGMDVYGNKNDAYFRRNVWGWRPLAELVCRLAPDITRHCRHWQSNDGDGLSATNSTKLAGVLRSGLSDGTIAEAISARNAALASMPDETCRLCHGTGVRRDRVGEEHGQSMRLIKQAGHPRDGQRGWCNGCDGIGSVRPSETSYRVALEDIREFAEFLAVCGGFKIC